MPESESEYFSAVGLEPCIEYCSVDAPKIDVVDQVAIVQFAKAGMLAEQTGPNHGAK